MITGATAIVIRLVPVVFYLIISLDFSCDSTIIIEGTDYNQTTFIIALRARNQKWLKKIFFRFLVR